MSRGGYRPGAGRKPKNAVGRRLDGGVDKRGLKADAVPKPTPTEPIDPPNTLTPAEVATWLVSAPYAAEAGTLTPATADDFAALCSLEVEMIQVLAERRAEGWTQRGLALAKEYRGLVARVEGKRRAFRLAPMGKEMVAPAAPVDDFDEFDGPRLVQPA